MRSYNSSCNSFKLHILYSSEVIVAVKVILKSSFTCNCNWKLYRILAYS